jgi:hypothetical protein
MRSETNLYNVAAFEIALQQLMQRSNYIFHFVQFFIAVGSIVAAFSCIAILVRSVCTPYPVLYLWFFPQHLALGSLLIAVVMILVLSFVKNRYCVFPQSDQAELLCATFFSLKFRMQFDVHSGKLHLLSDDGCTAKRFPSNLTVP